MRAHDLAEHPRRDAVAQADHLVSVAPHVPHGQSQSCRARSGDHGRAIGDRQRHRLFHQDVLAVGQRRQGLGGVQGVGGRNHHEVDGRIGAHRLPGLVNDRNGEPLGEGRGGGCIARGDRDDVESCGLGGAGVHRARPAGAQDAHPQAHPSFPRRGRAQTARHAASASAFPSVRKSATEWSSFSARA